MSRKRPPPAKVLADLMNRYTWWFNQFPVCSKGHPMYFVERKVLRMLIQDELSVGTSLHTHRQKVFGFRG